MCFYRQYDDDVRRHSLRECREKIKEIIIFLAEKTKDHIC